MRGVLFILGVLVLLLAAAMQFGIVRFASDRPGTAQAQAQTLDAEADMVTAEEPGPNRTD